MNDTVKQILENNLTQVSQAIEWETESLTGIRSQIFIVEKRLAALNSQKTDLEQALEGM